MVRQYDANGNKDKRSYENARQDDTSLSGTTPLCTFAFGIKPVRGAREEGSTN